MLDIDLIRLEVFFDNYDGYKNNARHARDRGSSGESLSPFRLEVVI